MLIGEGEYNINSVKELTVTDSFLGLDEEDKGCQNEEPLHNCTTRIYHDTISEHCGCQPINMKLSAKKVFHFNL